MGGKKRNVDLCPFGHDAGFMRAMEAALNEPKNLHDLPDVNRVKWEEEYYRRAMKWKWGFLPGDPRLESIKKDGEVKPGYFGKKVDEEVCEKDEEI